MIDVRLGEKKFIYTTFSDKVKGNYYNSLRSAINFLELEYISSRAIVLNEWDGAMKFAFTSKQFSSIVNLFKEYCPRITT